MDMRREIRAIWSSERHAPRSRLYRRVSRRGREERQASRARADGICDEAEVTRKHDRLVANPWTSVTDDASRRENSPADDRSFAAKAAPTVHAVRAGTPRSLTV